MDALVANLRTAMGERDRDAGVDGRRDAGQGAGEAGEVHREIGYPDKWRDYSAFDVENGDLFGNVATRRDVRVAPPGRRGSASRSTASEWGMTPADGQRLLQPADERDRLPGRDPAAAVLRSERRPGGQLRRHRRGDRPRDHPRLRRPGPQVRRRRHAARLVDAEDATPSSRRRPTQLGAQYDAFEPAAGRARQRQADDGREHRRPRRPRRWRSTPTSCR